MWIRRTHSSWGAVLSLFLAGLPSRLLQALRSATKSPKAVNLIGKTVALTCGTLLFWAKSGLFINWFLVVGTEHAARFNLSGQRRLLIRARQSTAAIRVFTSRFLLAGCICLFKSFCLLSLLFDSEWKTGKNRSRSRLRTTLRWGRWCESISCRMAGSWDRAKECRRACVTGAPETGARHGSDL